jgi:site-specific DNA-methyltransferase (adenine-specific)
MNMATEVNVLKIKEYPISEEVFENLRDADYEALKADIAKHGIKVALHILPDFTVICGHQRLRAARELGLETVPCEIKNLRTDSEIQEWAIKDNLLRRQLTTEQRYLLYAKLSELYEVGQTRDDEGQFQSRDVKVTSREGDVSERTARGLGESPATIARARAYKRAIEEMPELECKGTVISVLNEYHRRKDIERRKREMKSAPELKNLILGDALEKIDEIPDNSVDILLTDPPYGLGTGTARQQTIKLRGGEEKWMMKGDDLAVFDLMDKLFTKLKVKLKENAHLYVFTSWKRWHLLYPVVAKHFEVKNCLVWNKIRGFLGELIGYNYMEAHELVLFAVKGKRKLNWEGEKPLNILTVKPVWNPDRLHPTEKPTELCKILISYSTVEGETVLDPFAGSGSTLVAAEVLGRNWIGIEIDPQWYDVAKMRITELRKSKEVSENA